MNCAPMSETSIQTTEDAFLGGQLRIRQPRSGHRAGHDAMLLAAAGAAREGGRGGEFGAGGGGAGLGGAETGGGAREGDRVVEFGAGVGVAGLAVAKRCAGTRIVLVEIDPALAELARRNASANGIKAKVIAMDVVSTGRDFAAAGIVPDSVD